MSPKKEKKISAPDLAPSEPAEKALDDLTLPSNHPRTFNPVQDLHDQLDLQYLASSQRIPARYVTLFVVLTCTVSWATIFAGGNAAVKWL